MIGRGLLEVSDRVQKRQEAEAVSWKETQMEGRARTFRLHDKLS